jgi:hypothetical protein
MSGYDAQLERQALAVQLADWLICNCTTNSADVYEFHKRVSSLARLLKRSRESLIADLRDDAEVMTWAPDAESVGYS